MAVENVARYSLFKWDPASKNLWPRPGYAKEFDDCGATIQEAWKNVPKLPPLVPQQ